jgi:hypothetical protein
MHTQYSRWRMSRRERRSRMFPANIATKTIQLTYSLPMPPACYFTLHPLARSRPLGGGGLPSLTIKRRMSEDDTATSSARHHHLGDTMTWQLPSGGDTAPTGSPQPRGDTPGR